MQVNQLGPFTLQVIIKNEYSKDVTALTASADPEKDFRRDYIDAEAEKDQKLAAGASDEFLYNVEPGKPVVITGVLFNDRSFLGDYSAIKGVLDKRQGMKIQLGRFNSYLELLNRESPQSVKFTLSKVKQAAALLSLERDDKLPMSEDFEYGLRCERAFILTNLSAMESDLESKAFTFQANKQPVSDNPEAYANYRKRFDRVYNYFKN